MFDCGGEKIFQQREGYSAYFENTSMCAVVYDVGTPTSLQACGRWLSAVRHSRPERPIPGVLIANKIDLYQSKPDCLSAEAGERFASTNGLKFFEVSVRVIVGVRVRVGVMPALQSIARDMCVLCKRISLPFACMVADRVLLGFTYCVRRCADQEQQRRGRAVQLHRKRVLPAVPDPPRNGEEERPLKNNF